MVKVISLSWTAFVIFFLEQSFLFITKTYKHYKYQDKEECTIEGKCEVIGYRLNQIDITILQVNSIQILEEKIKLKNGK